MAEWEGFAASCFASCRPRCASGSTQTARCSTVHRTVLLTLTPSRVRNPDASLKPTFLPAGNGGVGGIRTLETSYPRLHDFQSCSLSQLGHHSARCIGLRARRDYSQGRRGKSARRGGRPIDTALRVLWPGRLSSDDDGPDDRDHPEETSLGRWCLPPDAGDL